MSRTWRRRGRAMRSSCAWPSWRPPAPRPCPPRWPWRGRSSSCAAPRALCRCCAPCRPCAATCPRASSCSSWSASGRAGVSARLSSCARGSPSRWRWMSCPLPHCCWSRSGTSPAHCRPAGRPPALAEPCPPCPQRPRPRAAGLRLLLVPRPRPRPVRAPRGQATASICSLSPACAVSRAPRSDCQSTPGAPASPPAGRRDRHHARRPRDRRRAGGGPPLPHGGLAGRMKRLRAGLPRGLGRSPRVRRRPWRAPHCPYEAEAEVEATACRAPLGPLEEAAGRVQGAGSR
mmetsp:Transcript_28290/g.76158  ORF Transcript_28290/g.76158 Transcript_28290/m.76158 type:complete len:289 (-) Transcript_28290:286-1152(-)